MRSLAIMENPICKGPGYSKDKYHSFLIAVIIGLCTLVLSDQAAGVSIRELYSANSDSDLSPLKASDSKHDTPGAKAPQLNCPAEENSRFDCWPEMKAASQYKCQQRGCCWKQAAVPYTAPWCFYPQTYDGYTASGVKSSSSGIDATLSRTTSSFMPNDIKTLKLRVDYLSDTIVRIKLYDPASHRYEVPLDVSGASSKLSSPQYQVMVEENPFNIYVTRKSTNETLFDTRNTGPLIFADQFVQMSTQLSTKYLYGLGEHRDDFLMDLDKWKRLVFWNRDDIPKLDNNGYGSHPFYLNLENGRDNDSSSAQRNAHGVFLLNSNAGDTSLQPYGNGKGAITYRFIGGILDFFVMTGPEPMSVVEQYAQIVGRPYFPPFWSLGFHLCKYGYQSSDEVKLVIKRNRDAKMPYDVQWTDIDYMQDYTDWTYDKSKFSSLPSIVEDLHKNKQRYIIIVDPGIASSLPAGSYAPFDDGKKMGIFIKSENNDILVGKVWPGLTAFPDFFHPNATAYWLKQASAFHQVLPYDGLWIDMNEPSNFVDGSMTQCSGSSMNFPPYVPPAIDSGNLITKTICPAAKHYISSHYNLHNMYGWSEANVTRKVLHSIFPNKKIPLISRSTFPGAGVNTGHWLGDNAATFEDLAYSIPGILNFNMFAIPQIGADICGFHKTTYPELCTRWTQLGVFYPFMRNHNDEVSPAQDPASFNSPYKDYIRSALQLRYRLLSVLYTLFYKTHTEGTPIVRPLMFHYPGTESIDRQFMWGDQLLVSPVLAQGQTTVNAFFPTDVWYDFYTGAKVTKVGKLVQLNAPIDHINVHIRGGSILTLLPATTRTDDSRKEKFEIVIAPDEKGNANGLLFWDDGENMASISQRNYSTISFSLESWNKFTIAPTWTEYHSPDELRLQKFVVLGVSRRPLNVTINVQSVPFTYDCQAMKLIVDNLDRNMQSPMHIAWS